MLAYFESHPEVDVDAVIHDNVDAGEHDKDVMVCTAATRNYAINMQDVLIKCCFYIKKVWSINGTP